MISGIFLLKRLNLQNNNYYLVTEITNMEEKSSRKYQSFKYEDNIFDKNMFINKYYCVEIPDDIEPCEKIYFRIMEEDKKKR